MFKKTKDSYYSYGAAITVGLSVASGKAHAGGNTFSVIAENITEQIQDIPGLLAALSYLFGVLLGVLGVMKIKDHVENPSQTPLKDGAVRLLAGGALFALPIIFESMQNLLGNENEIVEAATVSKVKFNVQ